MNIFKKMFGNNPKENIDNSEFIKYNKEEYKTFTDLFELNAGISFDKQVIFGELIGEKPWNLDMNTGKISFENLEFPIQIIGSLSFNDNSWLWGWANIQSGIPENLLIQSNKLKAIGEQKGISELIDSSFIVDNGFEHKIGMLACGLFNSKSYYCANYGQGTLVVTIDDEKIPNIDKEKIENILFNFPKLISGIELNHRKTFKNYLIDYGFELKISETKIEGLKEGKVIVAEFDELDRLKSLNGNIEK